jgi:hypothetical protein
MNKYNIRESDIRRTIRKKLLEQGTEKTEEQKPRCVRENMIPLDEIVGKADEYIEYAPGVSKRKLGVNSMFDTIFILNNIIFFKYFYFCVDHLSYIFFLNFIYF